MAKKRADKVVALEKYKEMLASSKGYIMVSLDNLDSTTLTDLKKKLRSTGAQFTVIKNTVLKIALQEGNYPLQAQDFDGASALVTYTEDPTAAAKLIKEVQKAAPKDIVFLQPKYGMIEGSFVESTKVMALADIPSREVLLAKFLGSINAPVSGFMNAVTGNVRGFVMVLKGLSEKK